MFFINNWLTLKCVFSFFQNKISWGDKNKIFEKKKLTVPLYILLFKTGPTQKVPIKSAWILTERDWKRKKQRDRETESGRDRWDLNHSNSFTTKVNIIQPPRFAVSARVVCFSLCLSLCLSVCLSLSLSLSLSFSLFFFLDPKK